MELHRRLAGLRKKRGLSQQEVADILGVSRQAVSKWESGQTAPSTENLVRLSGIYGVSVDMLANSEAPLREPDGKPDRLTVFRRIAHNRWIWALCALIWGAGLFNLGRNLERAAAYSRFIYPQAAGTLIAEFDAGGNRYAMEVSAPFWMFQRVRLQGSTLYHPDFPGVPQAFSASRRAQCGFELLLEAAYPEPTIVSVSSKTKGGEARLIVAQGQEVVEEIFVGSLPQELLLEPGEYRFFLAAGHYTGKLNLDMDWPSLPVWITPPGIEREKTPEELARFAP